MKFIRLIWKLLFVMLLVLSVTLNIAMFVGGMVYQMASSAVSSLTGFRTVAMQHADEVADLGADLTKERMTKTRLRGELAEATSDLSAERVAKRKLHTELSESTSRRVAFRGRKVAIKEAVDTTADRITKRAVATSTREVSAMAGEAMPYIGTAVIVGVTALELKDLCDTLKDMEELKRAFDPTLQRSEEQVTVCAMKVPSKEQLWELAKASPRKAWAAAQDAVPTLDEIKGYEFPDVDWQGNWGAVSEAVGDAVSATKSGANSALDATVETTSGWTDSFMSPWSDDEIEQPPPLTED